MDKPTIGGPLTDAYERDRQNKGDPMTQRYEQVERLEVGELRREEVVITGPFVTRRYPGGRVRITVERVIKEPELKPCPLCGARMIMGSTNDFWYHPSLFGPDSCPLSRMPALRREDFPRWNRREEA